MKFNYERLMEHKPSVYETMVNSKGQTIEFVEHPTQGDYAPIICICHELKKASCSGFFETDDMIADHKEYEPSFDGNEFLIGSFVH